MILNALQGKPLPIYGDGSQVRDWLFVEDHARALALVLETGEPGDTYNIGGWNEQINLDVVHMICDLLQELAPLQAPSSGYRSLVTFVKDRPGHDVRYAIDATRIREELGWAPRHDVDRGMEATVRWYLQHREWCEKVQRNAAYNRERLGLEGRGA